MIFHWVNFFPLKIACYCDVIDNKVVTYSIRVVTVGERQKHCSIFVFFFFRCIDGINAFQCECKDGFDGLYCENKIDE